jgi:acetate kinase
MSGRVFVVNCGSSSLKYRLVDPEAGTAVASGVAERIGEERSRLVHRGPGGEDAREAPLADHEAALRAVLDGFDRAGPRLADAGLLAIAHRVVHGGERFTEPVLVDDDVLAGIRELAVLAPLHNPVNALGIEVARRVFPSLPHVAIFDTAFHRTLPSHAHTYAVPQEWRTKHGVRRYGFHGTSHAFVSREAARLLGRRIEETNVIVLHLGNGASATAVAGGKSVDTSMGLTPLEGLVMGTRSGDLDPAVVVHLWRAGLTVEEIDGALNRSSGMLALAGDNDLREVHRRVADGDGEALLGLEVYCHRIRKYVGAYLAVLRGRIDAIVFTAGIGENDPEVRARSLEGLEPLGIRVDPERNAIRSGEPRAVSPDGAPVAVLVIPTDEELEMAIQAAALTSEGPPPAS